MSCLGSRMVLSLAEAERERGGEEGGRAGGLEAIGSFEQTLRWLHPMESVTWWGGSHVPLGDQKWTGHVIGRAQAAHTDPRSTRTPMAQAHPTSSHEVLCSLPAGDQEALQPHPGRDLPLLLVPPPDQQPHLLHSGAGKGRTRAAPGLCDGRVGSGQGRLTPMQVSSSWPHLCSSEVLPSSLLPAGILPGGADTAPWLGTTLLPKSTQAQLPWASGMRTPALGAERVQDLR